MFLRRFNRFRVGLTTLSVLVLLIGSAGSAAADTTPAPGGDATFTQHGRSADAWAGDCSSNGDGTTTCSGQGISVFVGKISDTISGVVHANQLCVSIESYTFDDETGEFVGDPRFEGGCAVDLPNGSIHSSKKLTSVSVGSTSVTIGEIVCGEETCEITSERDVAVEGTWTGFGPITTSKSRNFYDDGTCRYADSGKMTSREAEFEGSIDGAAFAGETYGSIADGRSTFRSRCSES